MSTKRWLTFSLAASLACARGFASAPESPRDRDSIGVPTLVQKVEKAMDELRDYSASLVQVAEAPGHPRRISVGALRVKKPSFARLDIDTPRRISYITDGKVLWTVDHEAGKATVEDADEADMPDVVAELLQWRPPTEQKGGYYAKTIERASLAGRPVYVLRIRRKGHRGEAEKQLWIDARTLLPCRLVVSDDSGASVTLTLVGPKIDTGLDDSCFTFRPDPSMRVEDLRKTAGRMGEGEPDAPR